MIRIAYICQSYPPMVSGAALVVQRLVEGITENGHSVLVLTASDQGYAYSEDQNDFKIIRLRSYRNPFRVDQSFAIWSFDEIRRELEQFQPDILHTHDPLNVGMAALHAAKKVGTPVVYTIHQLPWFLTTYLPIQPWVKDFLERGLWRYGHWYVDQCMGLITPSNMIADIVEKHTGYLPQVISNGVDLDTFTPNSEHVNEALELCQKYGLCPDHPVILYVGRIDPDKKVDLVIRGAARVMQEIKAQLFVVGDGKQREELIKLSHELGIHENCCFPGFISKYDDLPGIYRLARVFVTASEIEVQSSVVLEAAASGLPVVTVQASSMPELIMDAESGFLVPPGDVDALADRIISLVKDRTRSERMGQVARRMAEAHSNQRFVREHEQLYDSVFASYSRHPAEKILA